MPHPTWATSIGHNVKEVVQKAVANGSTRRPGINCTGRLVEAAVDALDLSRPSQPATRLEINPDDIAVRRANGTKSFSCTVRPDVKTRLIACAEASGRTPPLMLEEVLSRYLVPRAADFGLDGLDLRKLVFDVPAASVPLDIEVPALSGGAAGVVTVAETSPSTR